MLTLALYPGSLPVQGTPSVRLREYEMQFGYTGQGWGCSYPLQHIIQLSILLCNTISVKVLGPIRKPKSLILVHHPLSEFL